MCIYIYVCVRGNCVLPVCIKNLYIKYIIEYDPRRQLSN